MDEIIFESIEDAESAMTQQDMEDIIIPAPEDADGRFPLSPISTMGEPIFPEHNLSFPNFQNRIPL